MPSAPPSNDFAGATASDSTLSALWSRCWAASRTKIVSSSTLLWMRNDGDLRASALGPKARLVGVSAAGRCLLRYLSGRRQRFHTAATSSCERVDVGRDVFRLAAGQRHVHPGVRIGITGTGSWIYVQSRRTAAHRNVGAGRCPYGGAQRARRALAVIGVGSERGATKWETQEQAKQLQSALSAGLISTLWLRSR